MKTQITLLALIVSCCSCFSQAMFSGASPAAAGGVAYNPSNDLSVVEWLKGDGITGLTDGQGVGTWQATVGNAAVGTGGVNNPIYHTAVKNGLPAVLFASANAQFVATASFGTLTQPDAIWVVFKCSDTAADYFILDGINANRQAIYLDHTAASKFAAFAGSTADVTAQDTSWHILYVAFNGASSVWRIDGGAPTTISTGANQFTGIKLGANSAGSTFFNGYIAEVLVQNAIPADPSSIFTYLDTKWAVY